VVSIEELSEGTPISFKVNGLSATETPDVDVTLTFPQVRLDVCGETCDISADANGDPDGHYYGLVAQANYLQGSATGGGGGGGPYTYTWAWDLDNDGFFDDSFMQNPIVGWEAEGDWPIALRVCYENEPLCCDEDTAIVHITTLTPPCNEICIETLSGNDDASNEMKYIIEETYTEIRHVSLTLCARGIDKNNDFVDISMLLSDSTPYSLAQVNDNGCKTYEFNTNNWSLAISDSGKSPVMVDYYATVTYPH